MLFETNNTDVIQLEAYFKAKDAEDVFDVLNAQLPDDVLAIIGSKVVKTTTFARFIVDDVMASGGSTQFSMGGKTWTMSVKQKLFSATSTFYRLKTSNNVRIKAESKGAALTLEVRGMTMWDGEHIVFGGLRASSVDAKVLEAMVDIMATITSTYLNMTTEEVKEGIELIPQ
jgi:hypothetical protein